MGEGIEGLVHISEMAIHHVDLPEQVVTPGEELWVKIIDIDLQRRRISLSIKQAAEGGEVAAEYREALRRARLRRAGQLHRRRPCTEFEPESEAQAAWAEYLEQRAAPGETEAAPAAAVPDGPVWTSGGDDSEIRTDIQTEGDGVTRRSGSWGSHATAAA